MVVTSYIQVSSLCPWFFLGEMVLKRTPTFPFVLLKFSKVLTPGTFSNDGNVCESRNRWFLRHQKWSRLESTTLMDLRLTTGEDLDLVGDTGSLFFDGMGGSTTEVWKGIHSRKEWLRSCISNFSTVEEVYTSVVTYRYSYTF